MKRQAENENAFCTVRRFAGKNRHFSAAASWLTVEMRHNRRNNALRDS